MCALALVKCRAQIPSIWDTILGLTSFPFLDYIEQQLNLDGVVKELVYRGQIIFSIESIFFCRNVTNLTVFLLWSTKLEILKNDHTALFHKNANENRQ